MSGAIGVTDQEQGTRGLWWEKRKAFVKFLEGRGHKVDFVNRMTKFSAEVPNLEHVNHSHHDMLFVEFGSANKRFYGNDLEKTFAIVNDFKGPKVFINDDPDLPFMWDEISNKSNWFCWTNAVRTPSLGKQPINIPNFDMPFSSLMEPTTPSIQYQKERFVYIGRPNGRTKAVKYLTAYRAPWRVFGKQFEWNDYGILVQDAPNQPERRRFYSDQIGCLALADKKHKEMGWRTGRAYHAVMAGCPAILEPDHIHLSGFPRWRNVEDLVGFLANWSDPDKRYAAWQKQVSHIFFERGIAEKTLEAHGL